MQQTIAASKENKRQWRRDWNGNSLKKLRDGSTGAFIGLHVQKGLATIISQIVQSISKWSLNFCLDTWLEVLSVYLLKRIELAKV